MPHRRFPYQMCIRDRLNDASSRAQQMVEEAQKPAEETVNDAQAKATAIRTEASTRSREDVYKRQPLRLC